MTRTVLWVLTIVFWVCLDHANAQPKKGPVIGVFLSDTASAYKSYVATFVQNLKESGYVAGENISIEYRYTDGKRDKLSELANELVGLKVDVIVVVGGTLDAARRATGTIPIVAATAGDLVADGFVASLARPGGNITGTSNIDSELSAKRLELSKNHIPSFPEWPLSPGKGTNKIKTN